MTGMRQDHWEPGAAENFATGWTELWNDHDVGGVLDHFSDDVVFTPPVARRVLPDGDGVIRGKSALRQYWTPALGSVPDLRFELINVYVGVATLVINYRNQAGVPLLRGVEVRGRDRRRRPRDLLRW